MMRIVPKVGTSLFRRSQAPALPAAGALDYDEQKRLARHPDPAVRRKLALRADLRPEILYYLAEDASPAVRRAVAANTATPAQADELLSADATAEVREDLALKIGRLLPDMPADEQDKVRELTLAVLQRLAEDQLPRVRAILSETLRDSLQAPPAVIRKLAGDLEAIVACPVLEYSPLLSDHDLREIIAAGCAGERLCAIARRRDLSAEVSDDVVATLDIAAVATLLANESAAIRAETLERVAENARGVEAWHRPLAMRPELSVRAMRRIAGFVATVLVEMLASRRGLDPETAAGLRESVRRRLENTTGPVQEAEEAQAQALDRRGLLDDEALAEAIEAGRHDFVAEALSLRSGLAKASVEKLLRLQNPKAATALAWQAGLSMRTAVRLQAKLSHIPPGRMLNARNGTDYPLSAEEMTWLLEALA